MANLQFDDIRLIPGTNQLDPEILERLRSHPDFERYSTLEAIEVIESAVTINPAQNAAIADLKTYKVADAQTIITNTSDLTTLESWLQTESRTQVRTSLNVRIEQIKGGLVG